MDRRRARPATLARGAGAACVALLVATGAAAQERAGPPAAAVARADEPLTVPDLPPPPPPMPDAPAREAAEWARRPVEVAAGIGIALPSCRAFAYGGASCSSIRVGAGGALAAVWRLAPHVALGASVAHQRFPVSGAPAGADQDATDGEAMATWFGGVARAYFLERSAFDPWIGGGLGWGAVGGAWTSGGQRRSESIWGTAASASVGADFWIGAHAKVGPAVDWVWVFASAEDRCGEGTGCVTREVADARAAARKVARVGVALTVAMGPEM